MIDPKVVESADRLTQNLQDAKDGNYIKDAWYFYMRRDDVIRLINYVWEVVDEETRPVQSEESVAGGHEPPVA